MRFKDGSRTSNGGQHPRRGGRLCEQWWTVLAAREDDGRERAGGHGRCAPKQRGGVREWMERGDMWAQHVSVMLVVHVGRLAGIREDLDLVETSRQV